MAPLLLCTYYECKECRIVKINEIPKDQNICTHYGLIQGEIMVILKNQNEKFMGVNPCIISDLCCFNEQ